MLKLAKHKNLKQVFRSFYIELLILQYKIIFNEKQKQVQNSSKQKDKKS